jgi:hypothetical protein
MFKKLTDKIEKKLYGETIEELQKQIEEEEADWVPEDLISFKGKHISIVKFEDIDAWEELDELLDLGYEVITATTNGMYSTYGYVILKNPPEKH